MNPRNRIGGFGVLSTSTTLPLQVAWETFGSANGAATYEEFRTAIGGHRKGPRIAPAANIGCNALVETVFFPPELWFDVPASFKPGTQWAKAFSGDEPNGRLLWDRLQEAAANTLSGVLHGGLSEPRYGPPALIPPRLGQAAFRLAVTEAYGRQCALTTGRVLPALDAAHIVPYAEGGTHSKANGILLRKDIHSVFDAGYATIDKDHRFVVSDKVREVFNNGEEYRRLHGSRMRLPRSLGDQPDALFLQWHNENRFLG